MSLSEVSKLFFTTFISVFIDIKRKSIKMLQISNNYTNFKNTNIKNQPNFGYNYKTHRLITEEALKYVPEFSIITSKFAKNPENKKILLESNNIYDYLQNIFNKKSIKKLLNKTGKKSLANKNTTEVIKQGINEKFEQRISESAMLPDLLKSERGFFTNRHFYFSNKPFDRENSFGFNTEDNNAFSAFFEHCRNANPQKTDKSLPVEIGMMLHYLQDMTVPMHTRQQSLLGKALDCRMHKDFENQIFEHQDELIKNYKPNFTELSKDMNENIYYKIFRSNCDFSQRPEIQVKRTNKEEWNNIQQEIFNRAIDSTVIALKTIVNSLIEKV